MSPKSPRTLRRLTLSFLGLSLLLMWLIFGAVTYTFIRNAERGYWQARQADATHNAAQNITDFINQSYDALHMLDLTEAIASTSRGGHQQFDDSFQIVVDAVYQNNKRIMELILTDSSGQLDAQVSPLYQRTFPVIANAFAIQQSRWYQAAKEGETYLSDLQLSSLGKPYTVISQPVADGGIAAARLDMSILAEVLAQIRFGETGNAYVVDDTGKLLAHSTYALVQKRATVAERPELRNALAVVDNVWTGDYNNFQGESVVGSSQRIPGTDWIIFTEVQQAEAFATSDKALQLLTVIMAIGLFIVNGSAATFTAALVFNPLQKLERAASQFAAGQYNQRVEAKRHNEIGSLAKTFNRMADEVQRREQDLIAQAQALQIATEQAKESARLKGEFLASVSHELRTPLNAVIGFSDQLLLGMSGELNSKQQHKVNRIYENGQRLLTLINSILDFNRLDAKRVEIYNKEFRVHDFARRIAAQMDVLAEKQAISFSTEIEPSLPEMLMGDEQRLEQIAVNLISNAVKFTEQGGVTFRLRADAAAKKWYMVVEDTGIGIPPHALDSIFEEFRQVDASYTRARKGTGLGLAITRNLVLLMEGRVRVQSELGKGSTFTVELPLILSKESSSTQLPALLVEKVAV